MLTTDGADRAANDDRAADDGRALLRLDDLVCNAAVYRIRGNVTVGRAGQFRIGEDDLHLHRVLLHFWSTGGQWMVTNVGARIPVVMEPRLVRGHTRSSLGPGATAPLPPTLTAMTFSTPERIYEFHAEVFPDLPVNRPDITIGNGEETIGQRPLRREQVQLLRALIEPLLSRRGSGLNDVPTTEELAATLGWSVKKVETKADRLAATLADRGVREFRGAVNSRGRVPKRLLLALYALQIWDGVELRL